MKILVIRRDNIGDLVCTTPLLAGLRHHFPRAEICVLANSYNVEVLRGNPDIDIAFAYRKLKHLLSRGSKIAAVWHRISLLCLLRRKCFDLTILAKSGFDKHGLRLARQIGARRIVGFSPPGNHVVAGLTEPVPWNSASSLCHEVEVLADLVGHIGVDAAAHPLTVVADAGVRQKLMNDWAQHLSSANRLVALHVSAREKSRKWPTEKAVAFIEMLARQQNILICLMWAPGSINDPRHPGDDAHVREILARTKGKSVIALPTQTLGELVAALSICQIFIGADGGAMHIAAGLGLPVVGLFENSEFKLRHWYPWRVPHQLVYADTGHDVADIEPQAVLAAYLHLTEITTATVQTPPRE